MSKMDNIIILTGPTCVGKTEISIKMIQNIPDIEIISADSMQIYKYMDIGTAKPSSYILQRYKHHCIDIVDPFVDDFDVMKYANCAENSIDDIVNRDKKPLIVGGTGLYIKSLTNPIFTGPGRDKNIRKQLNEILIQKGNHYLFNQLMIYDPEYANKIVPNDIRRLIRALEVYYLTGKPISFFHKKNDEELSNSKYHFYTICISLKREKLYQKINDRVDQMIKKGLIEETKKLIEKYNDNHSNAMQCLGYKQIIFYLAGKYSLEESIEMIKKETRHFAKRQLSWFNNQIKVDCWINLDHFKNTQECVDEILVIMKKQGY